MKTTTMMPNQTPERAPVAGTIDSWALRSLAWAFLFVGFMLSAVSTKSCRFLEVTVTDKPTDNNEGGGGFATETVTQRSTTRTYSLGLFQLEQNGACTPIDLVVTEDLSASHKVAKAAAVMACVVGGINMLVVLCTLCFSMPRHVWKAFGCLAFICVTFQALTFVFFSDDECDDTDKEEAYCRVHEGGAVAIAGVVAYFLGGLLACFVPGMASPPLFRVLFADSSLPTMTTTDTHVVKNGNDDYDDDDGANKTVAETTNPDGSKTTFVTKTTHHSEPADF